MNDDYLLTKSTTYYALVLKRRLALVTNSIIAGFAVKVPAEEPWYGQPFHDSHGEQG